MSCIYCNGDVHPKRIEILQKKGALITCIFCAEQKVKRVTGFRCFCELRKGYWRHIYVAFSFTSPML